MVVPHHRCIGHAARSGDPTYSQDAETGTAVGSGGARALGRAVDLTMKWNVFVAQARRGQRGPF
eukprot:532994-Pyramimonas_sp.AAC.1